MSKEKRSSYKTFTQLTDNNPVGAAQKKNRVQEHARRVRAVLWFIVSICIYGAISTTANIGEICSSPAVSGIWPFHPICHHLMAQEQPPPPPVPAPQHTNESTALISKETPIHVEPISPLPAPTPAPSQSGEQTSSVAGKIFVTMADGTIVRATAELHGTPVGEFSHNATVTATQDDQGYSDWLHVQGIDDDGALVTGFVNREEVAPQ